MTLFLIKIQLRAPDTADSRCNFPFFSAFLTKHSRVLLQLPPVCGIMLPYFCIGNCKIAFLSSPNGRYIINCVAWAGFPPKKTPSKRPKGCHPKKCFAFLQKLLCNFGGSASARWNQLQNGVLQLTTKQICTRMPKRIKKDSRKFCSCPWDSVVCAYQPK